jgi:hypothetical protein
VIDEQALTELYDAFNRRDIDAAVAGLHPDVDWPNGWEGGRLHGREAVRSYWQRQWKAIDPSVEPRGFSPSSADTVRVTVHQIVRDLNGTITADATVIHTYQFEDGLVRRMDIEHPAP